MRLPTESSPLLALSIGAGLLATPAQAQLSWRLIPASAPMTTVKSPQESTTEPPRSSHFAFPVPSSVAATQPQPSDGQPKSSQPSLPTPAQSNQQAERLHSFAALSSQPVITRGISTAQQEIPTQRQGLQLSQSQSQASPAPGGDVNRLRESLRIPSLVKREKAWPSPSLSPGVPSAFVANWGDVFVGISGATAGKQRGSTVDGSWNAGFGLGNAANAVALEISGGCGSVKNFCANGGFTGRIGRLLVNQPRSRVSVAAAWQNFAQWGNEGRQDNVYYGALSYALPLRPPGSGFGQTLQFNAGVGNSTYAPFTPTNSQNAVGGFGSVGIELSPALGLSAGWSGRGANAQLSYTPFRDVPITLNVLGADLFNQTPAGTVAVFSVSWGRNFTTPSF